MRLIAILFGGFADDDPEPHVRMAGLRQGLQQLGWADGSNLRIEYRTGGGDPDRVRAHASDLTALAPDVIITNSAPALAAVQKVARATPIIFVNVADPVASGFVASLAHPGGNITGFTNFEQSMGAKWLELLKEIAPGIARVAVFQDAASPAAAGFRKVMEAAAPSLHVQLTFTFAHGPTEIERIIIDFSRETGGGMVFPGGTIASGNRKLLTQLTMQHRLPAIYAFAYYPRMDGLTALRPWRSRWARRARRACRSWFALLTYRSGCTGLPLWPLSAARYTNGKRNCNYDTFHMHTLAARYDARDTAGRQFVLDR